MVALPIDSGPSQTITAAIEWLDHFSAARFDRGRGSFDAKGVGQEIRDSIASLLHMYEVLASSHEKWTEQLPPEPVSAKTRDIAERYAVLFRRWHEAASRCGAAAVTLAHQGFAIPRAEELQDRIGFCPYIGLAVEDGIRRQQDDGGTLIPLGELRDELHRRPDTRRR
jgi:hypothetical protein